MEPILKVAERIGLTTANLSFYGDFIAKIDPNELEVRKKAVGSLILVSGVNPTPSGEGKTTISIGLLDAFYKIGKKAVLSLREPSMGPVFGMKGGATGAGAAKIEPSNEINLHFTGDLHAVTAANNLLCALVDNHVFQGNELKINPKTIALKRCLDVNDRTLRNVVIGLGSNGGVVREEGFTITAASEIMAILCLATSLNNLIERLGNIFVGFAFDGKPVFVKNLNFQGALAALLKQAFLPNLVQTLEGSPVLVHGGPFANIAHGCCSVQATGLALKLADYAITEAGFGSDLGAEKFFNIKCRVAGFKPSCVVLVVTAKALKFHGGVKKTNLDFENLNALRNGFCNLEKHVENMRHFGLNVVVAINRFTTDFESELAEIEMFCEKIGCFCSVCDVFNKGGKGAVNLAEKLVIECSKPANFHELYGLNLSLKAKMLKICKEVYGAAGVKYSKSVENKINCFEEMGFGNLPVCVCKTPYSLSCDGGLVGKPENFEVEVFDAILASGAGFVVLMAGGAITMPGFGKSPAASLIGLDESGKVKGLS